MSEPSDLPPEPIFLHHYGEEGAPAEPNPDESLDPQDEAQKTIDTIIAREARELVKHADPRVRAAAVFQLAPHEAAFFLGDPEPVVRLAAVRVCAAFSLMRVLLIDLKLARRDPSAEVRYVVANLLAEDPAKSYQDLPSWATAALIDSPLFDDEEPVAGIAHPRLRVLPSGSARERAASAFWARREVLDQPVEEVVPSPHLGDSCAGRKTVARVYANNQSRGGSADLPACPGDTLHELFHDEEQHRAPPAPRIGLGALSAASKAIVAATDAKLGRAGLPPSKEAGDSPAPIHDMTDKEPT